MEVVSVYLSEKLGAVIGSVPDINTDSERVQGETRNLEATGQVILMMDENFQQMNAGSANEVNSGEIIANIVTHGIDFRQVNPLDRFKIGEAELEVTRAGKDRILANVIHPGGIKAGDVIDYSPYIFDIQIITLSDRVSRGQYQDQSGPKIAELNGEFFQKLGRTCNIDITVIPDNASQLQLLIEGFTENGTDIIFTTGGTGIGPRDITADVVRPMLDKELPGIMEYIRYKYGSQNPNALISRSVAGVIENTLIFTLPGSVKAVNEYCGEILPVLKHSLYMLHGIDTH